MAITDQNIKKKTFPMWSKVRTNGKISKYKIYDKSEWCDLFYVKFSKNVKFLSGSRRPHGPDLPSPCGRKLQFQSVHTLLDDGRSISRNVAEKHHDSRHDKLIKQYRFTRFEKLSYLFLT